VDGVIVNAALQPPAMDQAAAACRERGRIVLVGGGPDIRVGRGDVFEKELDLLISRAGGPGRYDAQYERDAQDLPPAWVRWTEGRNTAQFVRMVAAGQIDMIDLITHRIPRRQAAEAYALLLDPAGKYSTMGVVFTYD
jgi:NADPH2:quinone reductase